MKKSFIYKELENFSKFFKKQLKYIEINENDNTKALILNCKGYDEDEKFYYFDFKNRLEKWTKKFELCYAVIYNEIDKTDQFLYFKIYEDKIALFFTSNKIKGLHKYYINKIDGSIIKSQYSDYCDTISSTILSPQQKIKEIKKTYGIAILLPYIGYIEKRNNFTYIGVYNINTKENFYLQKLPEFDKPSSIAIFKDKNSKLYLIYAEELSIYNEKGNCKIMLFDLLSKRRLIFTLVYFPRDGWVSKFFLDNNNNRIFITGYEAGIYYIDLNAMQTEKYCIKNSKLTMEEINNSDFMLINRNYLMLDDQLMIDPEMYLPEYLNTILLNLSQEWKFITNDVIKQIKSP
ncbi:MAG: hypothetical protein INQ03_14395 [Candidatus Heimdallarchaeota archaeon]|nr:hypothetical protein [Candidatus Heimdallarchaeota archaeon]